MKNNKKRILCGLLSAAVSISALTVTTSTVSVFAESSADHNDMVSVDFETTPDSKLLNTALISVDPDDSTNHVMKFENPKDTADNVIVGITPKNVLTKVPADNKTGVLTYEFDIKFPEDNPMENKSNGWYYPIYTRMAAFDGPITSILRTTNALPQSEVQSEKVDITGTKYTWYNVKQVFDYTTKEFKIYVQGKQLGGAVSFAADLESGKDLINALYFRAWAQGKFKWFVDNLKISYVEEQPQLVTGISVYDGDTYVNVDSFDYTSDTYNAQVYGDVYGQFDTVKNPVKVNLASGYEDATVETSVTAEVNGVKTMVVTVSKWPYTYYYTINCTAKPRPYYNGGISESFDGKTRDTVASFISLPGNAEIVNDGGGHGDVVKTTSANENNYFFSFNGSSLKDVCDADGRIIYEFDYKVDDKFKTLPSGESTPIAVKLSGNTFVYLRWDNIRCDSLNLTQNVITTDNPEDYDWIHMKFIVDTATKKIDIYVNGELFCSPSVSNLTKEQMFKGQLHWWSNTKNQSVVYIDNFSISYIASHPDMVSEIKLLDETFPDSSKRYMNTM